MNWSEDGVDLGEFHMARDTQLLTAAESGRSAGRIYRWVRPTVSLGRFQRPERALGVECADFVMRPTGGRAVLHCHDVTVAAAIPLAALGLGDSRSLRPVYRAVVRPLINALRACGLRAQLGEDYRGDTHQPTSSEDCFDLISPNDVVDEVTGQKVCGCALRITQAAVLLQASIPERTSAVDPARWIKGAHAQPLADWDPTSLQNCLESSYGTLEVLAN